MARPVVIVLSRSRQFCACVVPVLERRFDVEVCRSLQGAGQLLGERSVAGLVADFFELAGNGQEEATFLEHFRACRPDAAVVIVTDRVCPAALQQSVDSGKVLHLRGVWDPDRLVEWLGRHCPEADVDEAPSVDMPTDLREDMAENSAVLHGITRRFETNTPELRRMLQDLEVAAQHDVTILLIGETGSGKTFLSSLIHEVSPRRDAPFLPVACGALPRELIESELFGHVKGAFTSAHADKDGKFVAAGRGTILLDEIDVLGLEQQVKLLRVIETGEFEPVGSNKTLKSQARLVVASNQDLQPLVEQGKFRPDLYYRLNMLKFEIPPLRRRKADITMLAHKLIRQLAERHQVKIDRVERGFYEALLQYPWPGNVRELENVIQRAVIYCREGVLTEEHLPTHVVMGMAGPGTDINGVTASGQKESTLNRQIALTEREIIEQALFRNNFSRTNTAKELGISRVTLYNKMKKYGMTRK
ncbi:MAG: sigma-54-dependent Fis family transcriptional regulator [Planctomycetes bacterium]|nr:sigma-54-dependent Fis family transcriptional regulator [Planctomycetota bacterium]